MPEYALIIFDMDDTLVASGELWMRSESRLFRLLGHAYDPRIAALYKGMNALDVGRTIHARLQPAHYTADECGQLLRAYLLEAFAGPVRAMPGADGLLRRLAGRYRLALASGSPPEGIALMLRRFEWADIFCAVVSSESVARGKPAPDVFLETASRCGAAPHACLVVEDSLHGAHAAARAGMTCYVVPSSDDPAIARAAQRAFPSLEAIEL